jgi:hypothetical protein
MPVPLRNVAYVTHFHRFDSVPPAGAEHRHADFSFKDVLPLVGRWVPVQLAQCARFEFENYAGNRRRNRKIRGINAPFPSTLVDAVGLLLEE